MTPVSDRPRHRHLAGPLAAVLALALLAAACGGGSDDSGSNASPNGTAGLSNEGYKNVPTDQGPPRDGGTLRVGIDGETDGWNPVTARFTIQSQMVASTFFDPLMTVDENGQLVPYLAESVTPNADATEWTIKAKPNIAFHDGEPFDAEAMRDNIDRRTKEGLTSIAAKPIKSVEKVDEMTVKVTMNQPWAAYKWTLAAQAGYMAAPKQLADKETNTTRPIGTGPFTFVDWERDKSLTVKKFPTYWNGVAHLDGIEFSVITDNQARVAALQSGDVDLINTDDTAAIVKFGDEPGYVEVRDFGSEATFMQLNTGKAPFDNVNARLALAYSMDPSVIIENQTNGLATAADQPLSPKSPWHVADARWVKPDLEKAKQYLDRYKQETGQSELSFDITYDIGPKYKGDIAATLQQQWAAIGVKATVTPLEQTQFLAGVALGNYQMSWFRNFGWRDPDFDYIFWHSSTASPPGQLSVNFTQTKVPALDAALDKGREQTDEATRKQAYADAFRELNQYASHLWLYYSTWALIAKDKVAGLDTVQKLGFARQEPKTWWNKIWLKQ